MFEQCKQAWYYYGIGVILVHLDAADIDITVCNLHTTSVLLKASCVKVAAQLYAITCCCIN